MYVKCISMIEINSRHHTFIITCFRLVYVVCRDDDGRFQSPPDMDNSVEAAVRRVRVAGLVIQCALAEMLWTQRLGRKTFR